MILVIILLRIWGYFEDEAEEAVADSSQELMHSLAYRPDFSGESLHSPQFMMIVFSIFQERHNYVV